MNEVVGSEKDSRWGLNLSEEEEWSFAVLTPLDSDRLISIIFFFLFSFCFSFSPLIFGGLLDH